MNPVKLHISFKLREMIFAICLLLILSKSYLGVWQADITTLKSEQDIVGEQQRRAQRFLQSDDFRKYYIEKYPSRDKKVLEMFATGQEFIAINQGDDISAPHHLGLMKAGFEEGIKFLKAASRMDPNFPEVYIALGKALNFKAKFFVDKDKEQKISKSLISEAHDYFAKAIQLDPSNPDAYHGIADSTANLNKRLEYLNKLSELNPRYPRVHDMLAWNYELLGKFDEASREMKSAFDIEGYSLDRVESFERLVQKTGRYDSLLGVYKNLIVTDPHQRNFYHVLENINSEGKATFQGIKLSEHMDRSKLATFLVEIGSKAIEKNQKELIDPAQKIFKRAIELDPSKTVEVRKVAESSGSDQMKKFADSLRK